MRSEIVCFCLGVAGGVVSGLILGAGTTLALLLLFVCFACLLSENSIYRGYFHVSPTRVGRNDGCGGGDE
jgi:hypothetical protein